MPINDIIDLVDSKIDKAQYAAQNNVPYTAFLENLQEIRAAIMKLKDVHYNESHSSTIDRSKDETPGGEDSEFLGIENR